MKLNKIILGLLLVCSFSYGITIGEEYATSIEYHKTKPTGFEYRYDYLNKSLKDYREDKISVEKFVKILECKFLLKGEEDCLNSNGENFLLVEKMVNNYPNANVIEERQSLLSFNTERFIPNLDRFKYLVKNDKDLSLLKTIPFVNLEMFKYIERNNIDVKTVKALSISEDPYLMEDYYYVVNGEVMQRIDASSMLVRKSNKDFKSIIIYVEGIPKGTPAAEGSKIEFLMKGDSPYRYTTALGTSNVIGKGIWVDINNQIQKDSTPKN